MPFGASISCVNFQAFSDSISHIVKIKSGGMDNVNYLDDFLFIALLRALCNGQLELFLAICKRINFPVSIEKTFHADSQMTFLGFLIDARNQLVLIPEQKIGKARDMIQTVLRKKDKKLTVCELQQICGLLNFLGRAIIPGRAFTRCLYAFASGSSKKLKQHHQVCLNGEMKGDFTMWLEFLNHPSAYARGFMDFSATLVADQIMMTSDASRAKLLGFGGICGDFWMYSAWLENYIDNFEPSIEYLELFALVAIIINWIDRFQNRRIIFFCDNQAVVHMVNDTPSSCKNCMVLIR